MQIPSQEITFQTLELRFAQLLKIADKSRASKFSNPRILEFHKGLLDLINKMSAEDFSKFDDTRLTFTYVIIEQVFSWFEYIVNSTINQTPYEIVNTLEEVLSDWGIEKESYILLTSLSAKKDYFAFYTDQDPVTLRFIKTYIEKTYSLAIDLEQDVIRIILPKFLSHDYLTAVSLYHELAHYIDWKFKITDTILMENGLRKTEENSIPYREHFADLFAAQYVNLASCSHICYLTIGNISNKYPSSEKRVKTVNQFLNGKRTQLISTLKRTTKKCTGQDLKIRYKKVSGKDFNNLIPIDVKNSAELHGVFIKAWDIWLDPNSALRKKFDNKNDLYRILNNLVEKSVSNFFLVRSWNKENVSK